MSRPALRHSVKALLHLSQSLPSPSTCARVSLPFTWTHQQTRFYAKKAAAPTGPFRNRDIPYNEVRVVDETGKPGDPQSLHDVLQSLKSRQKIKDDKWRDVETHYVEVVRPPSDEMGGYALVRRFNKQEQFVKRKAARVRQQEVRRNLETKEIQLTWGAASADVEHKLRKIREELTKGHRATLVVTEKSGQAHVGKEDREAHLTSWLNQLEDIAREWAPRSYTRHTVVVQLQHKDRQLRPAATERRTEESSETT
ncbi:hypothetical protein OF83DRAFT_1171402 [Amylostereum chailletii]|nr:hypothetical protein OF83DRAFT_1171402 [Amylostereum chailletii]